MFFYKKFSLNLLLIFLSFSKNLWAIDYISIQDKSRCKIFNQNRDEQKALPFTKNICDRLTDSKRIDYSRQATTADKEIIFKAMMGNVMVHKNKSFSPIFNPSQSALAAYRSHLDALEVVNQSISFLFKKTLQGSYVHDLKQIGSELNFIASQKGFNYQELLTTHFIGWFYQSLEIYQRELNFFGGKATLEWFQKTSANFQNSIDFKDKNLKIITSPNLEQIGIYKSLIHTSDRPRARNRQTKVEYTSWLLAKAANLEKVVNPVLPVRIEGNSLFLDPVNYTGTLEPFVGITVKEDKSQETLAEQTDEIQTLYARILNYTDALVLPRQSTSAQLFTPNLWDFEVYFEQISVPSDKRKFRNNFIKSISYLKKEDIFNDLQTFNDSISVENIVSFLCFWHLTAQDDLNTTNIVYPVNAEGEIIPTAIDYDEALDRSERITQRIPQIYPLEQSGRILEREQLQKIRDISEAKLSQVMDRVQSLAHNQNDRSRIFTLEDKKKVLSRLIQLKQAAQTPLTIRSLMHKIISIKKDRRPELLEHYEVCDKTLKCSILDPLVKTVRPIAAAKEKGKVANNWYYPAKYIFEANWNTFKEGYNRGNDLKGYKIAPLKEVTD